MRDSINIGRLMLDVLSSELPDLRRATEESEA